ncbi:MAG: bifunctional oligoribonuclease/PAP phosphatase NrnA [Bacteroidetes bacterium]|nr:bifunctional oligoribonuclease/PAP phosphatase NrnA [Bacteroidota bacterium]MCK4361603.1 bifunctional oligoribonuclease/PAP phosphatase NrnA [Bacteroidales bacterium]
MTPIKFSKVKELLNKPSNIIITSHLNPDGDAIGSSLAMYNFLLQKNHNVSVIIPNEYPAFLAWMPNCNRILIYEHQQEKALELLNNADIIFCLDFNSFQRVEKFSESLKNSDAIKILIDHHPQPEDNFDYIISTVKTSSASELVYDFIVDLGEKHLINKTIAECIYVGIVTDTGSFSYLCNYEKTYLIIAELIKLGVNGEHIHSLVYDTFSENRLRLLGYCITEKLKVLNEFQTAYIYLSADDLKEFNYQVGDTEDVVNYPLSIININFAVLFIERKNLIRLSFRSKGEFLVNKFAKKHFKGGGHRNAAGGNSYLSLEQTLKKFEELLPQYRKQLIY